MKKLMLMLMVAMIVVTAAVLVAAGKPAWQGAYWVELNRLNAEKNYVAARAYVDQFDWSASQNLAQSYIVNMMGLDRLELKQVATIDAVKARVAELAVVSGLTDKALIDGVILTQASSRIVNKQVTYDFYKTLADPTDTQKSICASACIALKKYEEAESIYLALGAYLQLSQLAVTIKNKEKIFEYCSKAVLEAYLQPAALQQVLDCIGTPDYKGTKVTEQMQVDFLTAADRKYTRFLVRETNMEAKDKVWTPIITGIRLQKEKMLEKKDVVTP